MLLKLGVLTSGGDAPGMNAAIRAVVRRGIFLGHEVFGISHGYDGLLKHRAWPLHLGSVADIIHRGGTILRTARSREFMTPAGQSQAVEALRSMDIAHLVVIGGDGSLRGARQLGRAGLAVAGVPATIDNDIAGTELSIGFDTAVNTVVEAIDRVRDTATSHERVFVIETMGRDSGFLALSAGLAGGAESILIPEVPWDLDAICERLIRGHRRGKVHSIILVAEGAARGFDVAAWVEQLTGFETRVTVLGHLQRGGSPTATDRILGSRLGAAAVDALHDGGGGLVLGLRADSVVGLDIDAVLEDRRPVDRRLYELASVLAI
ncbi:MAG TPA: 6-phosphofructokinase [Clostridiales bacterium UBA8153]|nr:6-phosphofructokinase [Clostridiales bacterium UBA8153]